jgi:hypothetical protein
MKLTEIKRLHVVVLKKYFADMWSVQPPATYKEIEYYGNHSTSLASLQSLGGNAEPSSSRANFVPDGPLASTDVPDSGFEVNYETPQVRSAVSFTTSKLEI